MKKIKFSRNSLLILIVLTFFLSSFIEDNAFSKNNSMSSFPDASLPLTEEFVVDWGAGGAEHGGVLWMNDSAVYIAGTSDFNYVVAKYHLNGTLDWSDTWDNGGSEEAFGIWGDNNSVYVTGFVNTNGYDMGLVKWWSNGTIAWNNTWGGP